MTLNRRRTFYSQIRIKRCHYNTMKTKARRWFSFGNLNVWVYKKTNNKISELSL